jgi:hypothetical protein
MLILGVLLRSFYDYIKLVGDFIAPNHGFIAINSLSYSVSILNPPSSYS